MGTNIEPLRLETATLAHHSVYLAFSDGSYGLFPAALLRSMVGQCDYGSGSGGFDVETNPSPDDVLS